MTKITEKSWSLTTNSKFSTFCCSAVSMWHPNCCFSTENKTLLKRLWIKIFRFHLVSIFPWSFFTDWLKTLKAKFLPHWRPTKWINKECITFLNFSWTACSPMPKIVMHWYSDRIFEKWGQTMSERWFIWAKKAFFVFLVRFWAYVGQPHDHINWATSMPFTSINSTNPRTNPWNFREKFLRIGDFGK